MPYMTWAPSMSVGVAQFDEEHRRLIEFINQLHDAMGQGKALAALGPILTGLIAYTKFHFANEERLMAEHGYLGLPAHKREHDALTKRVIAILESYEAGNVSLSIEVDNFLSTWLQHHIGDIDKSYGAFFKAKGVR